MLLWYRRSLPLQAGLAVTIITALALLSTLLSSSIAWISEHDAAAINKAGSLRMATYLLCWKIDEHADAQQLQILRNDLQHRMDSPDIQQILQLHTDPRLQQAYQKLQYHWKYLLLPALVRNDYPYFFAHADLFVQQLNQFTQLLQQESEGMQRLQLIVQMAALIITIIVLLIGLYQLGSSVLYPLKELSQATEKFRAGDYTIRVHYRSVNELGQMAVGFNAMASSIENTHHALASQVEQKNKHLEQANNILMLLNRSSPSVTNAPVSAAQLDAIIHQFEQLLPGLHITLCLHGNSADEPYWRLALRSHQDRTICSQSDCSQCEQSLEPWLVGYAIHGVGSVIGELRVRYPRYESPESWEEELVRALADLIGTALSLERQRAIDHQVLLLNERNTIARELHDSLAQSLSFMKLQVSRLQALINRQESRATLDLVVNELRDGINNAYRHLRELLTTFRLQIKNGNLEQALQDTVAEFTELGQINIMLMVDQIATPLTGSEQIHILQISREALSNCVRHADAEHVWIHLTQSQDSITLLIEDDGIGISEDYDHRQHHGIAIMRERAESLRGELIVEPHLPHGTRVKLSFCPEFLHHALAEHSS